MGLTRRGAEGGFLWIRKGIFKTPTLAPVSTEPGRDGEERETSPLGGEGMRVCWGLSGMAEVQ